MKKRALFLLPFLMLTVAVAPARAATIDTSSTGCGCSTCFQSLLTGDSGAGDSGDYTYFPTPTKWAPGTNTATVGAFPSPGGATFSIMADGHSDASGIDTGHSGDTLAITALGVPGWDFDDYVDMINWALDTWAAVSGFTNLGHVTDGGVDAGALESSGGHLGDIRVAAWEITTSGVLAHAYQPGTQAIFGGGGTIAGDLHFDVSRTWVDDPTDTISDSDFDIYTVALHEVGHALGLGHSTSSGSVMEAVYAGARRTLTADDIAGIVSIYGPPPSSGIPEPSTLVLFGFGTFGLIAIRRSRRQK